MNPRSGKPCEQFERSALKRGFWGSSGLHLLVLVVLTTVPVVLWWDRDPKPPPMISVDFSNNKLTSELDDLSGLPAPVPEVEVVPPMDAEAYFVEAEWKEPEVLPPLSETKSIRPSPLESWPLKPDWLEERWAYRAAKEPPAPRLKPSADASVDPGRSAKHAQESTVSSTAFPDLSSIPPVADPGNPSSKATADQSDPIPDPQASPRPIYPWQAIRRRLQGVVQVLVEVDSNGKVVSARVAQTSGHGILDRAALVGVKKWKFLPARREGKAAPGAALVPIRFSFQDR